jgi:hypothetical protein
MLWASMAVNFHTVSDGLSLIELTRKFGELDTRIVRTPLYSMTPSHVSLVVVVKLSHEEAYEQQLQHKTAR